MALQFEKQYELPYSCSRVYSAWISSDTVIPPATAMDIDPVVGGHYRLIMRSPDFEARCEGIFSIVEVDRRVRYTWEWNSDGTVTEIDVSFDSTEAGTRVVIRHSGFATQDGLDMHASGWDSYIAGLTNYLAVD